MNTATKMGILAALALAVHSAQGRNRKEVSGGPVGIDDAASRRPRPHPGLGFMSVAAPIRTMSLPALNPGHDAVRHCRRCAAIAPERHRDRAA